MAIKLLLAILLMVALGLGGGMALLNLLEPPRPSLVEPIDMPQSEERSGKGNLEGKKPEHNRRRPPVRPVHPRNTSPLPLPPPASDDGGAAPIPAQPPAPAGDDDDDGGGDDSDEGGDDD